MDLDLYVYSKLIWCPKGPLLACVCVDPYKKSIVYHQQHQVIVRVVAILLVVDLENNRLDFHWNDCSSARQIQNIFKRFSSVGCLVANFISE